MADADKTALDAAQARYAAERTKRLRVDGNEQYSELAGTFADFDTDPYVEPGFTRDPIVEETTAVIVGFEVGGREIPYAEFVAPGMLAASAMNGSVLDSTFNFFFKLR